MCSVIITTAGNPKHPLEEIAEGIRQAKEKVWAVVYKFDEIIDMKTNPIRPALEAAINRGDDLATGLTQRALCIPISFSECLSNPNLRDAAECAGG